jgi:GAF domain-containing protein
LSSSLKVLGFASGFICLDDTAGYTADGVEESSPTLRLAAERGLPPPQLEHLQCNGFKGTLCAYVHERHQALTIDDLQQELPAEIGAMVALVAEWGWHAYVGIPLLHQAQSLGVISLFSRQPRTSTAYDLALLKTIGHQVGVALANARLFQSTLRERGRLNALIKASRDGVILVGLDLCVLVVNMPALQLLHLPDQPETWVGRPLADAMNVLRRRS